MEGEKESVIIFERGGRTKFSEFSGSNPTSAFFRPPPPPRACRGRCLVAHVHFWNESEIDGLLARTESQSVRLRYPFHPSAEISIPFLLWIYLSSRFGGGRGEAAHAHSRPIQVIQLRAELTQYTVCRTRTRTVRCSWSLVRYPLVPESPKIPNAARR